MYPIFGQIELICMCVYHVFTCQDMSSLYKVEFSGSSYSQIVIRYFQLCPIDRTPLPPILLSRYNKPINKYIYLFINIRKILG